ncbi:MAG TPA: hypothetical protein VE568_11485 [Rubrobacter sp.]|nr:hypothetical protein [Rubrobacter sp.]
MGQQHLLAARRAPRVERRDVVDGLIAGGLGLPAPSWLAAISVAAWVAAMWWALGERAIEGARAAASIR